MEALRGRSDRNTLLVVALAAVVLNAGGCGSSETTAALPNALNECRHVGWKPQWKGGWVFLARAAARGGADVILSPTKSKPPLPGMTYVPATKLNLPQVVVLRCNRINSYLESTRRRYRKEYFSLPISYRRRVGWGKWTYRHGYVWSRGPWGPNRDLSGWLAKFKT